MPLINAPTSIGTGVQYSLADGDSIFVSRFATVISTSGSAISSDVGSNLSAFVYGELAAHNSAIRFANGIDATLSGHYLFVGSTGTLTSSNSGFSTVFMVGTGNRVVNDGSIVSASHSALRLISGGDINSITNRGLIEGRVGLDLNLSGPAGLGVLLNSGTISGLQAAITAQSSTSTIRIINSGTITGDVILGSGADLVDTCSGIMNGTVSGGAGNDVFIGNPNRAETFNGGDGVDVLDFRNGGSVIVALDLSRPNSGQALGDAYFGFENVFGSQSNDILTGSNGNNVLTGEDGADWLHGRDGSDILRGGPGADTLAGGTGNDVFQYLSPDDGGDLIMDFANAGGNNDFFQVSAAGFGGGLVAGALAASAFQAGTTNVAANANVRFLHRTSDNTIWYDADGNGAGAAVLIATLAAPVAGLAVSATDFLIF
ncbi:calcium-binding protein [Paracoccus sp. IB05]|uniref:calcium-binding protein n=1 Tax=Paracoccus sp. IB05 TaxID=2779367 RepID=UPI0018E6EF8D|nr:calcium-binding protein [Paracoccus sp. IB05]MBJ2153373.1 hypothetical protein [Paracoccus sp. IB05]